jgi:hypothetical protein
VWSVFGWLWQVELVLICYRFRLLRDIGRI